MTGLTLLTMIAAAMGVFPARRCSSLGPLRWLLGEWTSHGEKRVTTEAWREASPETFEGTVTSRSLDTGEVVPVESLRLVAMSDGVYYIAKVPENDLPIAFEMTACDARTAVVENPGHDFPTKIAYRLAADGILTVSVTGGGREGFTLRYARAATAPPPDR